VPAAAVIPALIAYTKVVVVKTLVVQALGCAEIKLVGVKAYRAACSRSYQDSGFLVLTGRGFAPDRLL